jgi:hypothetical protein
MFWDVEVTQPDEEELVRKVAEEIHKRRFDEVAIMFLETVRPLSTIGSQLTRYAVWPFMPLIGDRYSTMSEEFLQVFEKKENVEKVIVLLEEMLKKDREESRKKKQQRDSEKTDDTGEKKGWRRFLPF